MYFNERPIGVELPDFRRAQGQRNRSGASRATRYRRHQARDARDRRRGPGSLPHQGRRCDQGRHARLHLRLKRRTSNVARNHEGGSKTGRIRRASNGELGPSSELEQILELMGRHGVAELEWEQGRRDVSRCGRTARVRGAHGGATPMLRAAAVARAGSGCRVSGSGQRPHRRSRGSRPRNQKQVVSPFVGTFYRSPSPTAEPYVREGQIGEARRRALHHRSDEAHERDRSRVRRARSSRSWSRTASRSSSASRFS